LAVLVVAAAALAFAFARSQAGAADDLARARVSELAARAEQGRVPELVTDVGDDGFAQVVVGDRVVGASASLGQSPPVTGWRPAVDAVAVRDLDGVPDDDETEDYRVWATTLEGSDGTTTVYVGTAHEVVAESVRRLAGSLAVGLPLLLVVSTLLLWLLVGRVLRPVHESHRRQREFVADAAHELQGPLASYRTQLEVALREDRPGEWESTARDLLAESDRMERLVRDLLFLARDDRPAAAPTTLVDLDDVVLEEVARLRPGTDVDVDTSAVSAAPVRGHRGDLGRLVRNLLANAARHAAHLVEVGCGAGPDGEVLLTVADDGPGIAAEDRERVFERFWRADTARSDTGSTGLGLSIVRAVAERHGGTVRVVGAPEGARFEVRLPAV
ncbi:MAG: sensor histidine kinase, partial [Nocardioidaceae bacterium]